MTDRKGTLRNAAFSALFFIALLLSFQIQEGFVFPSRLSVEVKVPSGGDTFQVFFDRGAGYNEADSVRATVKGGPFEKVRFSIPAVRIGKVRIDPGARQGNVLVRSICFKTLLHERCWEGESLLREYAPVNDISAFGMRGGLLSLASSGVDPSFEYRGELSLFQSKIGNAYLYVAVFLSALFFFLVLQFSPVLAGYFDTIKPVLTVVIRYRYGIAAVLFIILVSAKLHGSSLPVWDHFLKMKTDASEKSLLLGKERDIRSDEWLVQTPMYLSQAASKGFFPVINPNIRSDGQNMLVSYYAPALDITQAGKPFNWGFFLLGKEYGFSWYWWSKLLLLLLLSYEMCLLLTGERIFLSALGALWISFSPFIQWWFSTPLVDLIIYTQALVVAACRYFEAEKRTERIFLMTVLAAGSIGFALSLYPPFQVPLGYFILLFVTFFFFTNRKRIKLGRFDLVLVAAALLLVTGALLSFFVQSKEAIRLMMDTVYPGQRLVTGGGYDLGFLQFYLTNWRLPFHEVNFLNRCELSTFLNFFPAVLFLFFRVYRFDEGGWRLAAALLCYLLFLISWLFVQYPEWFARYSVFSRVPEHRLQVVISLLALYLSIWMLSLLSRYRPVRFFEAGIISLFISLFYLYSLKHTPMFGYLSPLYVTPTLVLFFLMNCSFLLGRTKTFGLLLTLLIVVSGMTVNPLSRGTGPLYHKVIAQKILAIEQVNPRHTWAAVNSPILGNYLISLGVKSLNSVHYYPDMKLWKSLDPTGKYVQAYNRYAHISLQVVEKDIRFEVLQPDLFTVFISPEDLRRVGVRYVLSLGRIPVESPILKEIDRVEGDNLFIYEIQGVSHA